MRACFGRYTDFSSSRCGKPVALADLFAAGWPAESVEPDSMSNRVHVALSSPRSAGRRDILVRRRDGYMLDPTVPIRAA